jgi:transcriptional regulator with XRE-family HTH domain
MSEEVGPAVRRRQLSRQLHEARTAAGFATMDAAAAATGLSRATISRIESAKQVILPRTVRLLCQIYGIGSPTLDQMLRLAAEAADDRGWQAEFAGVVPESFERYFGEEADATQLCIYQAELVPSLLQTDDYCRAVRSAAVRDVSDLDRYVAFQAARRERLATKKLHVVLNEAVLRREVGSREIMRAQLEHLGKLADQPNITIQVLPFRSGAHPAMAGSFTMLHFPPSTGVATVFVATDACGMYRDRPADFERYSWIFDQLKAGALDQISPDRSIA